MGIRLKILSIWIPKTVIKRELERTNNVTNDYLDMLIMDHGGHPPKQEPLKGNIKDRRRIMAEEHNMRVKMLIVLLGEPQAMLEVRKKMFEAGCILGKHAKKVLGVGESLEDTIKASKILYKVLGIDFNIEKTNSNLILWVNSCALSKHYTPKTCMIMSYADKGVLKGLNNNMDLEFVETITSGSKRCKGCINTNGGIL